MYIEPPPHLHIAIDFFHELYWMLIPNALDHRIAPVFDISYTLYTGLVSCNPPRCYMERLYSQFSIIPSYTTLEFYHCVLLAQGSVDMLLIYPGDCNSPTGPSYLPYGPEFSSAFDGATCGRWRGRRPASVARGLMINLHNRVNIDNHIKHEGVLSARW